ncbi:hypothetical protein B7Z17_02035 [Candidatus Saccharibacteria bacterium 32-49-10]|nr:MAG: hypothetical protein B7Z17_02035 [Candidatus Saccharibacteria bacterium 32-49-10]
MGSGTKIVRVELIYYGVAYCTKPAFIVTVYKYMSVSTNGSDEDQNASPYSTGVMLTLTFLDTTWRLFIPSVGLTVLGLLLDREFGTKPWLMVAGIIVGSAVAVYLVRSQLKKVTKDNSNKT